MKGVLLIVHGVLFQMKELMNICFDWEPLVCAYLVNSASKGESLAHAVNPILQHCPWIYFVDLFCCGSRVQWGWEDID